MNLDKLIDQWIGEEKNTPYKDNHTLGDEVVWTFEEGYNQALQDLKSRKQELIEGIDKYVDDKIVNIISDRIERYTEITEQASKKINQKRRDLCDNFVRDNLIGK